MHLQFCLLLPLLTLTPLTTAQLNTLAKAKGLKYFGSATDNPELSNSKYTAILDNTANFGQITVGNTQKWEYIEPSQNSFSYTQGDAITALAKKNGQMLRCHNLVWHNQLPNWGMFSFFKSNILWHNNLRILDKCNPYRSFEKPHQDEVTHYKGQCYAWDVVNEAFNDDGTYHSDVFYNTIGPEYLAIAFETARKYDSTVKLYYNDYNIENPGAKSTAAQNLVKSLKKRGIAIDGIGLQAHFIVGETPSLSTQLSNLKAFTSLGVEVAYTELDIRFLSLPPTSAGYTQQSTDYVNTVDACVQTKGCVGVTLWDYTDLYSWIPSTFAGEGNACLWNSNFTTKPAYAAVVKALSG